MVFMKVNEATDRADMTDPQKAFNLGEYNLTHQHTSQDKRWAMYQGYFRWEDKLIHLALILLPYRHLSVIIDFIILNIYLLHV